MLKVLKANHCDPESPSDGMCSLTCGGAANAGRHKLFRRYTMAALDHTLLCHKGSTPWLGGANAKADKAITLLGQGGLPPAQLGCGSGIKDAGVKQDKGLKQDSRPMDTGKLNHDAALSDPGGDPDEGCAVGGRGPGGLLLLLFLLATRPNKILSL